MCILLPILGLAVLPAQASDLRAEIKLAAVKHRNQATLEEELKARGLNLGGSVYLRIFKTGETDNGEVNWSKGWEMHYKESVVEAWIEGDDGLYHLFKSYVVCGYSGRLGPKRREGDLQTPEGFYGLVKFRPDSNYHLSVQVSYPNAYDRAHGFSGSDIYIHGDCQSIGCLAMTNQQMEEIYLLTWEASQSGQAVVPVDIFPFRMTSENLTQYADDENAAFWKELKPGYDYFEKYRRPPVMTMKDGKYKLASQTRSSTASAK